MSSTARITEVPVACQTEYSNFTPVHADCILSRFCSTPYSLLENSLTCLTSKHTHPKNKKITHEKDMYRHGKKLLLTTYKDDMAMIGIFLDAL
jgi:hypothetical protein